MSPVASPATPRIPQIIHDVVLFISEKSINIKIYTLIILSLAYLVKYCGYQRLTNRYFLGILNLNENNLLIREL